MKQLHLLICLGLALAWSGCVEVKIKSSIPSVEYYDFGITSSTACVNPAKIRLDIHIPSHLNTTNIITRNNNQLKALPNTQWIDLPSHLLRSALESKALEKCVFFTSFGAEKKTIMLEILDLSLHNDDKTDNDKKTSEAVVKANLIIMSGVNMDIIYSKHISIQKPIDSNQDFAKSQNLATLQSAISQMVEEIIHQSINIQSTGAQSTNTANNTISGNTK